MYWILLVEAVHQHARNGETDTLVFVDWETDDTCAEKSHNISWNCGVCQLRAFENRLGEFATDSSLLEDVIGLGGPSC